MAKEYVKAALLMYCYHMGLAVRLTRARLVLQTLALRGNLGESSKYKHEARICLAVFCSFEDKVTTLGPLKTPRT